MHSKRAKKTSFNLLTLFLIVFLIIALIVLVYFIYTYNAIQQSKQSGFAKTKSDVLKQTELVEIDHVERFQEIDEYHIVFGKTEENEEQIVFVPKTNEDEELTIVNLTDIISKEEIEKQWLSQCKQCKLISIKPAILNQTPLWELTYYDDSNRYVFDYVSLYDGSDFEKIRFQRKFK